MMKKVYMFITLILISTFLINCSNQSHNASSDESNQSPNTASDEINNKLSTNYSNFNGFDMAQDDIVLKIDGKSLNFTLPVYLNRNRYYLPLNEFVHNLNGEIEKAENCLTLDVNNCTYSINLLDNTLKCPIKEFTLKEKLLNDNDIYYIGFSDLSNILDLYTRWDKNNKTINCKTNLNCTNNLAPYKCTSNQIGFIRFEDICLTSQTYDKNYFENLRIIANYMNAKNIPYNIAWIPRYVNHKHNIDNDPITNNTFELAEMVYTLDYFTNHNGVIGLHGYTHQCGNEESAVGFEFGKYEPSIDIFKTKITKAIETASYLNIPIDFFEAPHYEITPEQNKLAEEYFKILYYPFNDFGLNKADLTKPQLSPYNNSSYYISTPLNYVSEHKKDVSLARIKNSPTSNMGSVFYHPRLENNYIHLSENSDGSPSFTYDDNSTLKRLINILEEKGFNMIKVTEIS